MLLTVQNITATSANIAWTPVPGGCRGGFYSVMYHPNWNSLLTGHTHRNFKREAAVPAGQTSTSLGDLSPHTPYVLCVSCQAAAPAGLADTSTHRCRLFNTLEKAEPGSSAWGGASRELAMGVWLASTILLAVITGVLLYSCLRAWCHWGRDGNGNGNGNSKGDERRPCSAHCVEGDNDPPLCVCAPENVPLSTQPNPEVPCATP